MWYTWSSTLEGELVQGENVRETVSHSKWPGQLVRSIKKKDRKIKNEEVDQSGI